jgi:hypothetical protein
VAIMMAGLWWRPKIEWLAPNWGLICRGFRLQLRLRTNGGT